jgi:hypothetical protein
VAPRRAPLFVFLGFRFGRQLQHVIELLKQFQMLTVAAVVVSAAGWWGLRRWRERRRRPLGDPDPAQPATPDTRIGPADHRRRQDVVSK